MAQHDYDIANQTAPNFRTDLNNVLDAIATNNSGTTAPTTTHANQWWYDTTNNILKIRNEGNTAWINVAALDQSNNWSEPYINGVSFAQGDIIYRDANRLAKLAIGTAGQGLIVNSGATAPEWGSVGFTMGAVKTTTSGGSHSWTGLPSGVKLIILSLDDVSLSGTANIRVQLGDSGGYETTGYESTASIIGGNFDDTAGFLIYGNSSSLTYSGSLILSLLNSSSNTWAASGGFTRYAGQAMHCNGQKSLDAELDRIRIIDSASDTFDAGQANILYL